MALAPISQVSTPFEDYPGYFIKGYTQGTTTPIIMATDGTGATTVAKAEISSGGTVPIGFIKTAGDVIFIPYFSEAYDLYLFPTAAEADANDTSNAVQVADNMAFLVDFANQVGAKITFSTVADMVADTGLSLGNNVEFQGYTTVKDGGNNSGTVVAAGTGVANGGSYIDLPNTTPALQFQASFPGGKVTGPQFGMTPGVDSTTQYNNAVAYITTSGLELDLLGATYIYNIAVLATGVLIDGFDNWKIHNGTLDRTAVFVSTETANLHHVKNCKKWAIDLSITGPATVFTGSISTDTFKGYVAVWAELGDEDFSVKIDISDNYIGLITGSGPATPADHSVTRFTADITALNTRFPVDCAQRGDNAVIKIFADKCHRPYIAFGIDNHEIDITTINPGTVSGVITAYEDDTTNIRGAVSITYTGDFDSRASLNGGFDIKTTNVGGPGNGKLDGVDLRIFARSLDGQVFGSQGYRPVVGFISDDVSQRIQNVTIDVDIEGWEGNNANRPAVGYTELTGYDGNNNPTFSAGFVEPIFDNIKITGRIVPTAADACVELTTTLAEGKITAQIDGSGLLRLRNLSPNPEARIQVDRSSFIIKPYQTGTTSSVDYAYMADSVNTWIGKSYNDNIGGIPLAAVASYQREDRTIYTTLGGVGSPATVQISELMPVDFVKYRLSGFTNNHTLDGVLQVRITAGAPLGISAMLWFESTAFGSPFGTGNITISAVNLNAGFLEIVFVSGTAVDLDFMSFTLSPLVDIGTF